MKLIFGTVLTIVLFVITGCFFCSYKEKHRLAHIVRKVLLVGSVIVLCNIISLFTASEKVCIFAYSAYFAAADWLLYYLLHFSAEYAGDDINRHVKKRCLTLLVFMDSVSILLNNIFGHLFTISKVTMSGGQVYYKLDMFPVYYVHYVIIIVLVVLCLISLFHKAVTAPVFYRKKYLNIALILLGLIIIDACTFKMAVDISVVGYAVEAICIYYCVFVYSPQRLLPETLFRVAQDMSVALFVMDIEGNKLYSNRYAGELLNEDNPLVNKDGMTFEQWCCKEYMGITGEFTKEESFYRDEEELILKIQLQRMLDVHQHVQGGYFVVQDRTEEINNMKKERYLATHDTLTGLYNKEYFFEKVEKYIKKNNNEEFLIICTDIKDFKLINDFLGARTGDIVLKNFGKMLNEQVEGRIMCGRLSNDVFGLLMTKKDYDEAFFAREDKGMFFSGAEKDVSFPIMNYTGVYEITDRELPVSVMCDRARMAIATIKGDFHKRVAHYDDALRQRIMHEQELIGCLEDAINEEQFKMYLQPQMSADGKMLGAEALVRWIHPVKGQIMPGEFVPVFERNGLISDVDKCIWELACRLLRKWKSEGRENLYISVNISPRDFYFLNIYQVFMELVGKYDIEPENLKLEITETAVVMDLKRQLELIKRLRRNGFIVEMDDFGSGYSSLNMLKDIHVDVLKIDMAFLEKANDEERSRKILQMIISLSKQLDMPVITEGVETAEQVEMLKKMGCNIFQGYYFAKPMPVEEFEEKYLK